MIISGIICEYNPFHNGHMFQLQETRKKGATHVIAIMSGNYVQRGEIALVDKHIRAEIAVKSGADLVIELPVPYSVSSAEIFSKGGVYILNQLGVVDMLSFGSESGDIELLKKAADASKEVESHVEVSKLISQGISYPSAVADIIKKDYGEEIYNVFSSPNNTLGIEYIKALDFFKSKISPVTITRKAVDHDSMDACNDFASASMIRELIKFDKDIAAFIPDVCRKALNEQISKDRISEIRNIENIIFYKLLSLTKDELSHLPDANNGLSDRLHTACRKAKSYSELLDLTKTKCFTLARIRRVISYALMGITADDLYTLPQYARILAFNDRGCEVLAKIKEKSDFPISTSLMDLSKLNDSAKRLAELDEIASMLFSLTVNDKNYRKNEFAIMVKKTSED